MFWADKLLENRKRKELINDSWTRSIDDSEARMNWGWSHEFDLARMTEDMA